MADNKIIKMKKENKIVTWLKDHSAELIATGAVISFSALMLAVYAAGVKDGKGPDIDEWIPVPFNSDGKIGVSMLGVKNLSDGGVTLVDNKDFLFEKHEYAANFANNMLDMIKEADANN